MRSKAASILLLIIAMLLAMRGQVGAARIKLAPSALPDSTTAVTGALMPSDIDSGTPSLMSDSLVIQLNNVEAPPAGFALQCYLLKGEDGISCGELAVATGVINTVRNFPGNNLVANYDTVNLLWEQPLFEDTIPAEALALIREVIDTAADTPGQIGYGTGLVLQAQLMQTHSSLARSSANAGSLGGAKEHAEHVLNMLYGSADIRYGDYDGDTFIEDVGDGFGILQYAARIDANMQDAAESQGATQHITEEAIAASAAIANFAPANDTGTWSDQVIDQAEGILAAGSAAAALPFATEMENLADQIIDAEGGGWTIFYIVLGMANFGPGGDIDGYTEVIPAGDQPSADELHISLTNVPQPPTGFALRGYLTAPNGERLVVGELPWNNGAVEVNLPYPGRNLIGEFNRFRVVYGSIYAADTLPIASLIPIRKVLAEAVDTPGNVAYGVGLVQQAQILANFATQISGAVSANNLPLAQQRAAETLNVLVGNGDPRYQDGVADPGDGVGVLGYAGRVDLAMQQTIDSSSATDNMVERAGEARAALSNISPATGSGTWADELITRLQAVIAAASVGAASTSAGEAATIAGQILNGTDEDGGARDVYQASQQTAAYIPSEDGTTDPDEPPVPGVNADNFENDDICSRAEIVTTDGGVQAHTFHYEGDQDWVRFTAQANQSYVIEVTGVGDQADPVITLLDACEGAPASFESNAFGNTVSLVWNSPKNTIYYIQLAQFDPTRFGEETEYTVKVTLDTTPPSPPTNLRCVAIDETTLGLQWTRSPGVDVVGYRVTFANEATTDTGISNVDGAATTFVEIDGLTPNEQYFLEAFALDFSQNESVSSGDLPCTPTTPEDQTQPVLNSLQPGMGAVYSTTAPLLTFSGTAQDPGENLSRAVVHNTSTHVEKSDFSLDGESAQFRVEDIPMRVGSNQIQITLVDEANNTTVHNMVVQRTGQTAGAVLIVAGHNETFALQTNIYNAANRAYRIFQSAGFDHEDIYYIAPVAQDADGDSTSDTDAVSSRDAIETAITEWALDGGRVGQNKPFFIYMVDHGILEKFCASGCDGTGAVTPADLDGWLRELEQASGVTDVTVVLEACQSGSFIDRFNGDVANSLSKQNRVIISSTGRDNNAYASAEGAYFSDAFFSCVADSNNLKACFDEGVDAVEAMGVEQTPWLDDNGDGVFNASDGALAQVKVVTRFFSSVRPRINTLNVERNGANGTLTAEIDEGAESVALVWAAVYPPSFVEPSEVTLNLNVPTVRLEATTSGQGLYSFNYTNGFSEEGEYRIVFYAQDRLGVHAVPRREGELLNLFLPSIAAPTP